MSVAEMPETSLRLNRAESSRLVRAFAISLAIHLLLLGIYQAGNRFHWWEHWHWPAWMQRPRMLTELFQKKPTPRDLELLRKQQELLRQQVQVPLSFLEVNPAQATAEAPKKAVYYSDKNSKAANQETAKDTAIPKIDGRQTDMAKTEDVPRAKTAPQTSVPPVVKPEPKPEVKPEPKPEPKPESKPEAISEVKPATVPVERQEASKETKPKPALAPGDLDRGRPTEKVQEAPKLEARAERRHLHTLKEARAQQQLAGELAGEKMKQEGGVKHFDLLSSLDAMATPFGEYDSAIVHAVQQHWDDLLNDWNFAGARTGKVTLRFHLNSNGRISQMSLVENTVDLSLALICEQAVREPSPYAAWPSDMKRLVGADYREVTFTFIYR